MKILRAGVFTFVSLFMTAACSMDDSNKLVGTWQSNDPRLSSMRFSKDATYSPYKYYQSCWFTINGTTYTGFWCIRNDGTSDKFLWLGNPPPVGPPELIQMSASRFKIIELTSDKFVVQWDDRYSGNGGNSYQVELSKVK